MDFNSWKASLAKREPHVSEFYVADDKDGFPTLWRVWFNVLGERDDLRVLDVHDVREDVWHHIMDVRERLATALREQERHEHRATRYAALLGGVANVMKRSGSLPSMSGEGS